MYKKSIVTFIDILGFKDLVNQSTNSHQVLDLIHGTLMKFKSLEKSESWTSDLIEVEEDAQKKGLDGFGISNRTKCTCFSDSIVISIEIENDLNEVFSTLIANLSRIGAQLLKDGILIRGGIDLSDIYHNNGIVFGKGLINSYELETNAAKYPRIILAKNLISELNYPLLYKNKRYPYHQYLDRFEDGCVGIHQLIFYQVHQNSSAISKKQIVEDLKKSKDTIIHGLDSNFVTPHIFDKYKWLKNQYNKLIILEDNIKEEFHDISEPDSHNNIHYSYIDKVFNKL